MPFLLWKRPLFVLINDSLVIRRCSVYVGSDRLLHRLIGLLLLAVVLHLVRLLGLSLHLVWLLRLILVCLQVLIVARLITLEKVRTIVDICSVTWAAISIIHFIILSWPSWLLLMHTWSWLMSLRLLIERLLGRQTSLISCIIVSIISVWVKRFVVTWHFRNMFIKK